MSTSTTRSGSPRKSCQSSPSSNLVSEQHWEEDRFDTRWTCPERHVSTRDCGLAEDDQDAVIASSRRQRHTTAWTAVVSGGRSTHRHHQSTELGQSRRLARPTGPVQHRQSHLARPMRKLCRNDERAQSHTPPAVLGHQFLTWLGEILAAGERGVDTGVELACVARRDIPGPQRQFCIRRTT